MKSYFNLSVHEKINLKQYAININNDKRLHFLNPKSLCFLNELQIHTILN